MPDIRDRIAARAGEIPERNLLLAGAALGLFAPDLETLHAALRDRRRSLSSGQALLLRTLDTREGASD